MTKNRLLQQLANTLLYEGYLLYPYRPSALKNRHRFNFGVLSPPGSDEAAMMQTECIIEGGDAAVKIDVRCLHLIAPETAEPICAQAAVEREVSVPTLDLTSQRQQRHDFAFPGEAHKQQPISGAVEITIAPLEDELHKLTVRILNLTESVGEQDRDERLMRSLISVHTVLSVQAGRFLSMLDPPAQWRVVTATCNNIGCWPVLVGEEGATDLMLSSPIILYDYPRIALESENDLFDATEIDEILTLRIMLLTEEEKAEMRRSDTRARKMLERIEALSVEQLMKLHGALRSRRELEER